MPEPRWLRPIVRIYLIVASSIWVTAYAFELSRWAVGEISRCAVPGGKGTAFPDCALQLPIWVAGLVGLVGVLAAYLAARLTRPRVPATGA